MKIRTTKHFVRMALSWYTDELYAKHHDVLLTPARMEIIRRDLQALQQHQQHAEKNTVWDIPVVAVINQANCSFFVEVADESNILYLDFDQ